MGLCWSPLTLLCLLEILVSPCHGRSLQKTPGTTKDMTGSKAPCQVHLEIDTLKSYCLEKLDRQSLIELSSKLGFRSEKVSPGSDLSGPAKELSCSFISNTNTNVSSVELRVVCQEATTKAPVPTQRTTVTTPELTGPERFLLVEGKERLRCAGVVELYKGSLGGSICYDENTWTTDLGNHICQKLNCGSFLELLQPPEEKTDPTSPQGPKPLPILWEVRHSSKKTLDGSDFARMKSCRQNQTLSIVCSDFQPKVKSRLKDGNSPCRGIVEVYFENQWKGLCGTKKNWEQVCYEQHCGNLISKEEVSQKATSGRSSMLHCNQVNLSHCYTFTPGDPLCNGIMIECQDLNAAGPGAGTVMSIILTLILVALLLVTCGPVAYKKLEKKFRQKKQRQWIGPTGVNQNVSFHRNHTVTIRSQAENPGASSVENEYSQPPRHSRLSAYPALEGALDRASNPPDNSSDSDYDLHGAQRL
ncbi:T-cell surface glycoprotein CD5 [Macrotis lagotis]|uniref:T-cell surface glycoprotein CD5 n=1 Tax=Macrotis lagotis TaxID=92651 RepID=UPI003D69DAFC